MPHDPPSSLAGVSRPLISFLPSPLRAPCCVRERPADQRGGRCCACPETKSARDDCFLNTDAGEADEKCKELVQRHIACMRSYGFKI